MIAKFQAGVSMGNESISIPGDEEHQHIMREMNIPDSQSMQVWVVHFDLHEIFTGVHTQEQGSGLRRTDELIK